MGRGRASVLGLLFLFTAACGGGGGASSASSPSPTTTGTISSRTDVPDVVVRDVGTGADVNLRALGLPDRPTLYWFWAPH